MIMRIVYQLAVAAFFAGAAVPASAQKAEPPAARLSAAHELLNLTGAGKQFEAVIPLITQQMTKMLASQKPEKRQEIEQVMEGLSGEMIKHKQELIDEIAGLYATAFSDEDFAGLIAFYKTPTGKKFIEMQPNITKGSMLIGQRWGQKIGAQLEKSAREELKKRGIEL